jgi:hypothetical protein
VISKENLFQVDLDGDEMLGSPSTM